MTSVDDFGHLIEMADCLFENIEAAREISCYVNKITSLITDKMTVLIALISGNLKIRLLHELLKYDVAFKITFVADSFCNFLLNRSEILYMLCILIF